MAVAVVAEDVMHSLSVGDVCIFDGLIELFWGYPFKAFEDHILMSLTKSEIVIRNVVWTSEIVDHALGITDAGVADDW